MRIKNRIHDLEQANREIKPVYAVFLDEFELYHSPEDGQTYHEADLKGLAKRIGRPVLIWDIPTPWTVLKEARDNQGSLE
jgi:hypothetical protein